MLVSNETHSTMRIVPCYLGGNRYSFDIADITALTEDGLVNKTAAEGPIRGWIQRRGQRVPVYSLAERLGLAQEAETGSEVAIILKRGAEPIAVSVDRVTQPLDVESANIHPLPAAADPSLRNLIRNVLWHEQELWLHMDAARLSGAARQAPAGRHAPSAARQQEGDSGQGSGAILAFGIPSINPGEREVLFAVSARQVLEILEEASPVPVPASPSHLRGLIAWRKRPVPLIDLGRIMGWAPNPREKTAVLVVRGARFPEPLAMPIAAGAGTFRLPIPHSNAGGEKPAVPDHLSSVIVDIDRTSVCVLDVDDLVRPRRNQPE